MIASKLFDIRIPFRSKYDVKQGLFKEENEKKVLEILTTKKLLKASRDVDYAQFLNEYDQALIQGNITHFFAWQNMKVGTFPKVYADISTTPSFIRYPVFFPLFILKLIKNYFLLTLTLLLKYRYSNHTKIEPVVAKNLMFEIIKKAEERGWSINNINTDLLSDNVTSSFIRHMYPDLEFRIWDRKVTAIQTYYGAKENHRFASFYTEYPMFWEVRKFLIKNPSDILLIATREGGKEQEFLQLLKYDEEVDFKFACVYDVDDINGKIKGSIFQRIKVFFAYIFKATLNQFYIALDEEGRVGKIIQFESLGGGKVKEFLTFERGQNVDAAITNYLKKEGLENIKIKKIDNYAVQQINSTLKDFLKMKLTASKMEKEVWQIEKV